MLWHWGQSKSKKPSSGWNSDPQDVQTQIERYRRMDRRSALFLVQGSDGLRWIPLPLNAQQQPQPQPQQQQPQQPATPDGKKPG